MHVRKASLDVFSAACTFNAAGTMAGAAFGGDMTVIRRSLGRKGRRRWCGRMDGRWRMFDFADGSVLAWDFQTGDQWAVESRTAAEVVLSCNGEALLPVSTMAVLVQEALAWAS